MIHKLPFINHFHAQYENFLLFCLDTSLSNRGMLKFKPCYENRVYLAHYGKHKNLDLSRGFVKISASCFSVLTWRILISPLILWSLKKWWQMSMCLVLEWLTGLFASLMALSLSHNNGILVKWHPKSWRVCLILVDHNMHWLQHIRPRRWKGLPNFAF